MRIARLLLLAASLSPPLASAAAEGPRWVFAPADCERLQVHVPDPDVTYRPGADVDPDGVPVVPPDLPGSGIAVPDTIVVDITELLGPRRGRRGGEQREAWIGRVEVGPDGRATFNGQPLPDPEQEILATYCRRVRGR